MPQTLENNKSDIDAINVNKPELVVENPLHIETPLSILERIGVSILKCGPIPHHVAIILDGNRRYARLNRLNSVEEGHNKGFENLNKTREWCIHIGIKELTVYALSIENFKRPKNEVKALMNIFRRMFNELKGQRRIKVRVFGNLSLLPNDLQKLMADIAIETKNNDKLILNYCISYTSRHEIANAFNDLSECVRNQLLEPTDITESLISKVLFTSHTPEPDLLIRTSGEHRFSDFMLWQSSFSVIYFTEYLWPEFSIWVLLCAVFYYQKRYLYVKREKENYEISRTKCEDKALMDEFELNSNEQSFEMFAMKKTIRITQCLAFIEHKRLSQLETMRKNNSFTHC